MSLRDYLAIHVDVSSYDFGSLEAAAEWAGEEVPDGDDIHALYNFSFRVMSRVRYAFADAMLTERERDADDQP